MKTNLILLLVLKSALCTALAASVENQAHRVAKGETLSAIARQHGCTVAALKKTNALTSDLIRIGQELKLPGAVKVERPVDKASPPPAVSGTEAVLKALPESDRWKLHIFLDRSLFAPGKVDGMTGEFTVKAAERWIAAKPGRSLETLIAIAREEVTAVRVTHTIPEAAAKFVGEVPAKLEDKAAAKMLPYENLAEFVAERYHTDLSTLKRLNAGRDLGALKIGDSLEVPAVTPFKIESWSLAGASKAEPRGTTLHINHALHMLELLNANGIIAAAFPITVGTKPEHVRSGTWQVRSLTANPTFLWDDVMLKEGKRGPKQFLLPPGPNNPVGIVWLELEPVDGPEAHIGIHGTNDPARIGRNHSSGCIRLANWDIVRLAKLVGKGTLVTWNDTTAPATLASTR